MLNTNKMARLFLCSVVLLSFAAGAEEKKEESKFILKQLSTIDNFPLKSIDQKELSAAAIGGGLQATSGNRKKGAQLPAYAEQLDEEAKKKQGGIATTEADQELQRAGRIVTPPSPDVNPRISAPLPSNVTYQALDIRMQEHP
jgi:hypothetical protein